MSERAPRNDEQLELPADQAKPKRKRRTMRDTSIAAGARNAGALEELRARILLAIEAAARNPDRRGATADEVHEEIAATESERVDVRRLMHVRRRISDLHAMHRIHATQYRRVNLGGNAQIVWAPVETSDGGEE